MIASAKYTHVKLLCFLQAFGINPTLLYHFLEPFGTSLLSTKVWCCPFHQNHFQFLINCCCSYKQKHHKTSTRATRLQQMDGSASPAVSAIISESSSRTVTLESGIEAILSTEEGSVQSHEDEHVGHLIRDSSVEFRYMYRFVLVIYNQKM